MINPGVGLLKREAWTFDTRIIRGDTFLYAFRTDGKHLDGV
jgi:hypothetical protein